MTPREIANALTSGCFVSIVALFLALPFWVHAADAVIFAVAITIPVAGASIILNARSKP